MFAPSFLHPPPRHPRVRTVSPRATRCALAPQEPPLATPTTPRKQSLPTHRERLFLQALHVTRPRGRAPRYMRAQNMSLMAWPLTQAPPEVDEPRYPVPPIPAWAYIVRVRAAKSVLGKRAVVRNRARRRVKAAAARVLPAHARRGWEYVFAPGQGALEAEFEDLVDEMEQCLRSVGCWEDYLTREEVVRPVYCARYR